MKIANNIVVAALVVVAGCGSTPDLIQLDGPEGTISTTAASTMAVETTSNTAPTTTAAVEETSTSAETSTTVLPSGSDIESGALTWAEPGTPEAELEQAYWKGRSAYVTASRTIPPAGNHPLLEEAYADRALDAIQGFVSGLAEQNLEVRDLRESLVAIESAQMATADEGSVTVCYLDQATTFDLDSGELVKEFTITGRYQQLFRRGSDGTLRVVEQFVLFDEEGVTGCALEAFS